MFKPNSNEDSQILNRFVKFGLIYAEIKEYLSKEFQEDGFSGCTIKHHNIPLQIILQISKSASDVAGPNKCRIKQVKSLIAIRLGLPSEGVEILLEVIKKRGLCPVTQAENIKSKLIAGINIRRAVNGAIRAIREEGAQGVEIIISGKTKGQRARSTKFVDGLLIHAGQPSRDFMRSGFTSVLLKLGVIGIKVRIMLPYDPEGIIGPSKVMCDKIVVLDPKE